MHMKKVVLIFFAVFALTFSAKAQDNNFTQKFSMEVFAGAGYMTSNNWAVSSFKHILPNASVNVAYQSNPWLGFRASLSGPVGNFPKGNEAVNFNYLQLGLDATIDIINIFNYSDTRFLSPYIFIGGVSNYRFPVENALGIMTLGARAGLGLDFRLSPSVKLALEFQDNGLNNRFNTLDDNEYYGGNLLHWKRPFKWDDVFAALVGLKFDL